MYIRVRVIVVQKGRLPYFHRSSLLIFRSVIHQHFSLNKNSLAHLSALSAARWLEEPKELYHTSGIASSVYFSCVGIAIYSVKFHNLTINCWFLCCLRHSLKTPTTSQERWASGKPNSTTVPHPPCNEPSAHLVTYFVENYISGRMISDAGASLVFTGYTLNFFSRRSDNHAVYNAIEDINLYVGCICPRNLLSCLLNIRLHSIFRVDFLLGWLLHQINVSSRRSV